MNLTTEQAEAEAAKAMQTDAAAMEKLMGEHLDQPPPPIDDEPPPPTPPEPKKHEEPKPPGEPPKAAPTAEPPAPPAAAAPEPDEFERDLDSGKYDLPAGATRQAKEANKALRQTARDVHSRWRTSETTRIAAEKRGEELQKQVDAAKGDREELDRLRPIVETFAIESDPRLNAWFNGKVSEINGRIMQNLASRMDKATIDYITANGGPLHFSRDATSQVDAAGDRRGDPPIRMSHKQFWEERVMNQLNDDDQRPIRIAFDDEVRAKEQRDGELRSRLSNREQYFKGLEEESKRNEAAFKAECKTQLDLQLKDLGDLATPKTVPADATPSQKERIETFNKLLQEATDTFDSAFMDTSPKALIAKNLGGRLLPAMKTLLKMKEAEIAEVKAELDAVTKKWNASLKAASTSRRESVQQQPKPVPTFEKNDGRRMEQLMEQLP